VSLPRTLQTLRRWDAGVARLEGLVVTLLLLSMIAVAAGQALWFNLAERGVDWAARLLEATSWADPFLQKGTLWLAFIGASLATHEDRHFAIDLVTKVVPERAARALLRVGALGAGLVSLALAAVFFHACLASDKTVPFEYEQLTANGREHVCGVAALAGAARPELLCSVRAALGALGVPISTLAGASQLIVPLLLVVIALRLIARALGLLPGRAPSSAPEAGADSAPGSKVAS
jgi:Tripartite ATP-independent periplasmic transporters, DctQ component